MWKKVCTMLLTVITALHPMTYASGSKILPCCGKKSTFDTVVELQEQSRRMMSGYNTPHGSSWNGYTYPDTAPSGSGGTGAPSWTLKKVAMRFCIFLLFITFAAAVVGISLAVTGRKNNSYKNDILNKSTTLMPMNYISQVDYVNTALSTPLPTNTDTPPIYKDSTIKADTNEEEYNTPTQLPTNATEDDAADWKSSEDNSAENPPTGDTSPEGDASEMSPLQGNSSRVNPTEEMENLPVPNTTPLLIIYDPICKQTGLLVYKILDPFITNPNTSHYTFAKSNAHKMDEIKNLLVATKNIDCGAEFFSVVETQSGDAIAVSDNNPVISEVKDVIKCAQCAVKVISILDEKGFYTNSPVATSTITTPQDMDAIKAAEIYINGRNCGEGYFTFTSRSSFVKVKYNNANPYIYDAWKPQRARIACANSAISVVNILNGLGKFRREPQITDTLSDDLNKRQVLIDALTFDEDFDCKSGYFDMDQSHDGYVTVQYESANIYVAKAWGRVRSNIDCATTGTEVKAFLKEVNLFSSQVKVTHVIPAEHVENLKSRLVNTKYCNCGDGFFTVSEETNPVTLTYSTKNRHVQYFYRDITDETVCSGTAYEIMRALGGTGIFYIEKDIFMLISGSRKRNIVRYHDNAIGWDCEAGFFNIQEYSYETNLHYNPGNKYIAAAYQRIKNE